MPDLCRELEELDVTGVADMSADCLQRFVLSCCVPAQPQYAAAAEGDAQPPTRLRTLYCRYTKWVAGEECARHVRLAAITDAHVRCSLDKDVAAALCQRCPQLAIHTV